METTLNVDDSPRIHLMRESPLINYNINFVRYGRQSFKKVFSLLLCSTFLNGGEIT